jgi:glycerophosphoryl diester phosphodiesterase
MSGKAGVLSAAAALYLLAVRPRGGRRAEKIRNTFYAHRGLHDRKAGVPENTLAAFQKAVEAGYGIELDVQLTKDEKAVVFHDFNLKRICQVEGEVSDFTYEELQAFPVCGTEERIPLFSDVLKLVAGRVPLLVELKYKGLHSHVCEQADACLQKYQGEYVIESFHPRALWWYRRHRPDVCRGQLSMNFQHQEGNYNPPQLAASYLLFNFLGNPDFIAYDLRDRKALSLTVCRKLFRCPTAAWTVRSRAQLETARETYDAFIFEGFLPEQPAHG